MASDTIEKAEARTDEQIINTETAAEQTEVEKEKKKGLSNFAIAVIVALAAIILTTASLLIFMLGGISSEYTPEDIGLYTASAAEKDSVTVDISGLFEQGFSIELKNRGKCVINLNGSVAKGSWSCANSVLTVSGGGIKYFGYVSDGVMLLQDVMNEGIDLTLKSDSLPDTLAAERAGKFYINSFTVNEQKYEGDMLKSAGFGDWYIKLDESGTGEALMFGSDVTPLIWGNNSITCTNGLILPYSFDDGTITIDYAGMTAVTFKNDDALDPFTDEGLSGTMKTDTLEAGSLWIGTFVISDHEGEGSIQNGSTPVYGFLYKDSDGKLFFEIYTTATRKDEPLMSFYAEIKDGALVPVIGQTDGWILDYWLNANDVAAMTMPLENSALTLVYLYNYQNETCKIILNLRYAGMS